MQLRKEFSFDAITGKSSGQTEEIITTYRERYYDLATDTWASDERSTVVVAHRSAIKIQQTQKTEDNNTRKVSVSISGQHVFDLNCDDLDMLGDPYTSAAGDLYEVIKSKLDA